MFLFDFAVAVDLGPVGWSVAVFSSLAFIVMFMIASIKGDQKGMIESMLSKSIDKNKR